MPWQSKFALRRGQNADWAGLQNVAKIGHADRPRQHRKRNVKVSPAHLTIPPQSCIVTINFDRKGSIISWTTATVLSAIKP